MYNLKLYFLEVKISFELFPIIIYLLLKINFRQEKSILFKYKLVSKSLVLVILVKKNRLKIFQMMSMFLIFRKIDLVKLIINEYALINKIKNIKSLYNLINFVKDRSFL